MTVFTHIYPIAPAPLIFLALGTVLLGSRLLPRVFGGSDLLSRPDMGQGPEMQHFAKALDTFLPSLPIRPIVLGNVYGPTFGNDRLNF